MDQYCSRTGESHCKCLQKKGPASPLQVDLKASLRKLFTDHAVYTALALKAIVSKGPDLSALIPRLFRNQVDIGDQLKPIIGDENGAQLTLLLRYHINHAVRVIDAAAKNGPNLRIEIDDLLGNGDAIAKLLTSLNPEKLPLDDTTKMFRTHNQYVIEMTTNRLKGDFSAEQTLFDSYYNEILEMSDMIFNAL